MIHLQVAHHIEIQTHCLGTHTHIIVIIIIVVSCVFYSFTSYHRTNTCSNASVTHDTRHDTTHYTLLTHMINTNTKIKYVDAFREYTLQDQVCGHILHATAHATVHAMPHATATSEYLELRMEALEAWSTS